MHSSIKAATITSFLIFITSATQAQWPKSCGADSIQYKVKAEKIHTLPVVEADKVQVVFLEKLVDDAPHDTVRYAADSSWVGANHGDSYFVVSMTPGVHHLCSVRQSASKIDKEFFGEVAVNLEAGKTYFFEFTITHKVIGWARRADGGSGGGVGVGNTPNMTLREGDSINEGSFGELNQRDGIDRVRKVPMSISSAK